MILLSGLAWAAENIQPAASLSMPLMWDGGTARAMSMGSAVVAVPQGSASLFWNPAGLGLMENCPGQCGFNDGMEVGLHHNTGLGDSTQDTAVIGVPMGIIGGIAVSLNYVSDGTLQGRDSVGNLTSDYSVNDMGASVGWGKQLGRGISVGAALKYNKQSIASTTYSAYAGDLGFLWNAFPRFMLGATYANLGTKVADSILDSGWRVGASYGVNKDLLVAVSGDLKQPGNQFSQMQIGLEDWFSERLALRLGFVHTYTDQQVADFNLTGLTAGIGYKIFKSLVLDYGYIPSGDVGISQRLSLTFKFQCTAQPVEPAKVQPVAEVKPVPVPVPVAEPNVVVLEKLIILEDTHFAFDSAALTPEGKKIVAENAQILKDNPGAKIRVAGYSSCSGTAEYNQKLSERRALAVKNTLLETGIAADRVSTIGYGATRPAEFEPYCNIIDSKAAKANMRVLFEIQTK